MEEFELEEETGLSRKRRGLPPSTLKPKDWFQRDDSYRFIVQPLDDIYLSGTLRFDLTEGGNERTVKTLMVIALLIIFIASVNFINLTTARSSNRAKEVGIKKMMGTNRATLALQFIMESVALSLFSVVISFGLAELGLIIFEQTTGLILLDAPLFNSFNFIFVVILGLMIGVLAGIYPAFYLSSFSPSSVLKGDFQSTRNNSGLRNILVVFQFTLSIILIICSVVMYRQLDYIRNFDKGFDQTGILILDNSGTLGEKLKAFKNSLEARSEVQKITIANRYPGSSSSFSVTTLKSETIDEPVKINRFRGQRFLEICPQRFWFIV